MDHREQKELKKKHERKEGHRQEMAGEKVREQKESKGTRVIHPLWLGVIGIVLATLALLRWMAIL
jgi:hypothetical protein